MTGLRPEHLPRLHALLNSEGVVETWRTRGRYLASAELERLLGSSTLVGVITAKETKEVIGIVDISAVELVDGHGQLSIACAPEVLHSGYGVEAAFLFMDACFARFPLRKLYSFFSAATRASVGSALGRVFDVEGTLREHLLLNGTYHDVSVASISRQQFLDRIVGHPVRGRCASYWTVEGAP